MWVNQTWLDRCSWGYCWSHQSRWIPETVMPCSRIFFADRGIWSDFSGARGRWVTSREPGCRFPFVFIENWIWRPRIKRPVIGIWADFGQRPYSARRRGRYRFRKPWKFWNFGTPETCFKHLQTIYYLRGMGHSFSESSVCNSCGRIVHIPLDH